MVPLQRVGQFREIDGEDDLPSLREAVRTEPQEHEAEIVRYLRSGHLLVASPGPAFDVLSETRQIAGPQHVLNDGTWSWGADLAYYVEHYHCVLPRAFVAHMAAQNWQPPGED